MDGVKAEGTAGNWAHHVTIEKLNIVNYGVDQQAVGISTKCPAWNWIIRSNIIIGAGTGMYLGNSSGNMPFVNGIIENNLIKTIQDTHPEQISVMQDACRKQAEVFSLENMNSEIKKYL